MRQVLRISRDIEKTPYGNCIPDEFRWRLHKKTENSNDKRQNNMMKTVMSFFSSKKQLGSRERIGPAIYVIFRS